MESSFIAGYLRHIVLNASILIILWIWSIVISKRLLTTKKLLLSSNIGVSTIYNEFVRLRRLEYIFMFADLPFVFIALLPLGGAYAKLVSDYIDFIAMGLLFFILHVVYQYIFSFRLIHLDKSQQKRIDELIAAEQKVKEEEKAVQR